MQLCCAIVDITAIKAVILSVALTHDTVGVIAGYLTPLPPLPYLDELERATAHIPFTLSDYPWLRCACEVPCVAQIRRDSQIKEWYIIFRGQRKLA
jgi:hypothetical protein